MKCDIPPEVTVAYRNEIEKYELAKGYIGQYKGNKAVRLTDEVIQPFMEDLTSELLETDVFVKIKDTPEMKFIRHEKRKDPNRNPEKSDKKEVSKAG